MALRLDLIVLFALRAVILNRYCCSAKKVKKLLPLPYQIPYFLKDFHK